MKFFSKIFPVCLFLMLPVSACAQTTHSHEDTNASANTEAAFVRGKVFSARIVSWERGPKVSDDTSAQSLSKCVIEIITVDGQVPQSITVTDVFPYMKMHGHGAPSGQIIRSLDGNKLTVDNIMFIMSGSWELHVKATVNGQTEELELPVAVP